MCKEIKLREEEEGASGCVKCIVIEQGRYFKSSLNYNIQYR